MHVHVQVLWHTATAFSQVLVQAVGLPAAELSKQATELAADRHEHVIPVPTQSESVAGANGFLRSVHLGFRLIPLQLLVVRRQLV